LTWTPAALACSVSAPSKDNRFARESWEAYVTKHRFLRTSALGVPLLVLATTAGLAQQPATDPMRNLSPVTDAMLRNPPPADWLMWRRTYDAWGYSPLDQINKDNVNSLKVAWTWSLTTGPTETTPI